MSELQTAGMLAFSGLNTAVLLGIFYRLGNFGARLTVLEKTILSERVDLCGNG